MPNLEDDLGGTDITGIQSPQHPHQAAANASRKAQNRGSSVPSPPPPRPTPDSRDQPDPGSQDVNPSEGKSKGGPSGGWGEPPAPPPPPPGNPLLPGMDWEEQAKKDAWLTYHTGRGIARSLGSFLSGTGASQLPAQGVHHVESVWGAAVDPQAVSASVQNIWEQDTAQAHLARILMTGGGSELPGQNRQQQGQQMASAAGEVLPVTADPRNILGMGAGTGLIYRLAAFAGPGLASGLASQDPNEQASALTWAAITAGVIGHGHLPSGLKEQVGKALGRWPELQDALRNLVQAKRGRDRNSVDPNYHAGRDLISETLRQGPLAEQSKVIAEAGGALPQVEAKALAGGEIAVRQTSVAQQRSQLLRRLGVNSVDDLVTRAQAEPFTGKAAKLIAKNWQTLGLPYDLRGLTRGDTPLRDPRRALLAIHNSGNEGASIQAHRYLASVHHYLDQIHRGPFSNSGDPLRSVWRALTGVARHDRLIDQNHSLAAAQILDNAGVKGDQVSKAIEGDLETYNSLPPQAQIVVDGFRLLTNALRHESQGTDYARNFVGNWLPHIDRLPGRGTKAARGSAPYATESRKSRNLAIRTDERGNLVQTQQFSNLGEANKALAASRQRLVSTLTDPLARLPKELENDPRALEIRKLALDQPEAALQQAQAVAAQMRPDKEMDFLKILGSGVLTRQMKALHSHKALDIWARSLHSDGKRIAVKLEGKQPQRHADYLGQQGYVRPQTPFAGGYMVHPELARLLDKATSQASNRPALVKGALDLESQAIARIMFMPPVHAMNVASRLGMMWMSHPIATTRYLLDGKALAPHMQDEASYLMRSEAYNAGVLPHSRNLNYAQQLQGQMGDALGDTMQDLGQTWNGKLAHAAGFGRAYEKADQGHAALNSYFWGAVNDFGVMAYHLEKDSAVRAGLSDEQAKLWAARRANTWMGHVAMEDHNPAFHDLARMVAFAPNWWRTWAELVVPAYRDSGINYGDPNLIRHIAGSQAKLLLSMFAFQKLTGNALNLMASGHLQNQNLPGNQDRLELTAPWIDRLGQSGLLPSAGGLAGLATQEILKATPAEDPRTGARRTAENPLGRFQRDLEEVGGLQSGHPDWKPQDAEEGAAKFLVSRLSPLAEGVGALFNFDPYHALTSGFQNTRIDRSQPLGLASDPQHQALNTLYAALMMSPLGLNLPQQIAQNQQKDANSPPVNGPFGTKIPKSVADSMGSLGGDLEKTLLSWSTGVNPPYDYAQRSRGQQPSDQQYQRYVEAKTQYQQQMASLSAQALGGQITPSQWLDKYKQIHQSYSTIAESTFKNAPAYVHGDEGMMNDYLALQQQATAPDGSVDYQQLDQLQAQFRQDPSHSPDALQRMDVSLSANDQRYPMLGLYHKTLDAYRKWQQDYAAQHGVDISTLRQEITQYGALYGDNHASAAYLASHRQLAAYENAKRRQWEASPAGLMYGLFYNSSTVATYMRAKHLTEQQVVQQAEGT